MRVTLTTPGATESFIARADAASGIKMWTSTNLGSYAAKIQPIIPSVFLLDSGGYVLNATVNATFSRPDGSSIVLPLLNDGQHYDANAGDGVYANELTNIIQTGNYTITFSASGTSNTGQAFKRIGQTTVIVEYNPSPVADMFVTMTAPAQIRAGSPLTYTITYGNNGPENCADIAVSQIFPIGTRYLGDSRGNGADLFGVGKVWTIGALPANSQNSFIVTVSVPPTMTLGSGLTSRASIVFQQSGTTPLPFDPNFDNNSSDAANTLIGLIYVPYAGKNSGQTTGIQKPVLPAYPAP
jgi:uncharacterized repeat protein (TIGR01451 family)